MKVYRHRRSEKGPRFTIASPSGKRPAKHPGEPLALIEAQREAERSEDPITVRVVDEEVVLFTVTKNEAGHVLTWAT